jgi:hypothetical protein
MLTENERQILEIFSKRLLLRKDEIKKVLAENNINDGSIIIQKLSNLGYLRLVEAVGLPCYTITQEGLRALKK